MSLNHRMAERHESDIAERFGGRKTRGSGNQWSDPADGRQNRYEVGMAFAWDCKASLGSTITISRIMWDKIVLDAHGERPMLPVRFYDSERLDVAIDLVAITVDDMAELLELAQEGHEARKRAAGGRA